MFDIKAELDKLPNKPGVYIMKDEKGVVIYHVRHQSGT
jgi:excinuclease ABC subunit C